MKRLLTICLLLLLAAAYTAYAQDKRRTVPCVANAGLEVSERLSVHLNPQIPGQAGNDEEIPGQAGNDGCAGCCCSKPLCLVSVADSTPGLAPFDFGSDNCKWDIKLH